MLSEQLLISRQSLEAYSQERTSQKTEGGLTSCTVLGKYILFVDTTDTAIVPHLLRDGYWESWITVAMARILQPSWTCLDVGANLGYYSVMMADAVGDTGKVLAIEPHPQLVDLLQRSFDANNFTNVEILNKAVSSVTDKNVKLFTPEHKVNSSLNKYLYPVSDPSISIIETITLDQISQDIGRIDFIKMDIEGSEENAWYGMQSLLRESPHVKIFMEVNVSRYNNPEQFLRSFQKTGLKLNNISDRGLFEEVAVEQILTHEVGRDWILFLEQETVVNINSSDTKHSIHPKGINLIGDTTNDSGLAESTRTTLDAIIQSKIPVSYITFNYKFHKWEKNSHIHRYNKVKKGSLYDINLMFHNLYDFYYLEDEKLQALTQNKYTIGYWVWEQTTIPKYLHRAFYGVDEIWTASRYCREAFSSVRPIPIHVIPHPIEVKVSNRLTKTQLGVPEDRFTFLFSFAAPSVDARKNPLGLIEAFRNAFPKDSPQSPVLILKVHHLDLYPEYANYLKNELSTINSILIEESLSRQEMNNLLASVDCYISLHRAEGFGLGMAEAMALGKPVIATHYSGNVDFMNTENSFPVRYTLQPITEDDFVHQPDKVGIFKLGDLWADPDLDHAAELMQRVISNPELAMERGRNAKAYIHEHFSPNTVGKIIQQRLREINPQNRNTIKSYQIVVKPESEIMTRESHTHQNTHEDLVALLRETEKKFHQWDYRRVPETRHRIYKLPVLGYFLRTFERIRNLGKMWADLKFLLQSLQLLNTAMVDRFESVQSHQQSINQLTVDVMLHNQRNLKRVQEIDHLKAEIARLNQHIEQLNMKSQLSTQHSDDTTQQ